MLITQSTKLCFQIWCDSKKPSTSPLLMIFSSQESLLVLADLSFFSLDTTSMTGLFILIPPTISYNYSVSQKKSIQQQHVQFTSSYSYSH